MRDIYSWGRLSGDPHRVVQLQDPARIPSILQGNSPGLPLGMARSYGDVCLNPGGILWDTTALNHLIGFDEATGILSCEAGVLLQDIQRVFAPRGWLLPVTPGTEQVTVGGAIANDVHGKNHHSQGSFGDHVKRIVLVRTTGEIIECTAECESDWHRMTIGGLGLTGVIVEADICLRRVASLWLEAEAIPFESVEEFFDLSNESADQWEYTVSWVSARRNSGIKGIFQRGRHLNDADYSVPARRNLKMPVVPPFSLVNPCTVAPFNALYYWLGRRNAGRQRSFYEPFLYPLDRIAHWNRIYGRRGFYQFQCVVPQREGIGAVRELLARIDSVTDGSFLSVLKVFGNRIPKGALSFPMPGVTLAMDFPNRGDVTTRLFSVLCQIVSDAGGRIYPAKDACMSAEVFHKGYPELGQFLAFRDPGVVSGLANRLLEAECQAL